MVANGAAPLSIRIFLSVYRALSLIVAALQLVLKAFNHTSSTLEWGFLGLIVAYTTYKIIRLSSFYHTRALTLADFGFDVMLSGILPALTGAVHSPFLLFCLNPVLTSALLFSRRLTFSVAGIPLLSLAIGLFLNNGLIVFNGLSASLLGIYLIMSFMVALLPYMMNINVYHRVRWGAVMQERNRQWHDIHDGVIQSLVIIRWRTEALKRSLVAGDQSAAMRVADEIGQMLVRAEAESREAIARLRENPGSLVPTLAQWVAEFARDSGIKCELQLSDSELSLPLATEIELLYIAREALMNVKKHAGADRINISFQSRQGFVEMVIHDNGRGLGPEAYSQGHGLTIMADRAKKMGGKFYIESSAGYGTEIKVRIDSPKSPAAPPVEDSDYEIFGKKPTGFTPLFIPKG